MAKAKPTLSQGIEAARSLLAAQEGHELARDAQEFLRRVDEIEDATVEDILEALRTRIFDSLSVDAMGTVRDITAIVDKKRELERLTLDMSTVKQVFAAGSKAPEVEEGTLEWELGNIVNRVNMKVAEAMLDFFEAVDMTLNDHMFTPLEISDACGRVPAPLQKLFVRRLRRTVQREK